MADLPTVIDSSGLVPTAPATLRANTVTYAEAASPGISTDLPGTLIEDLASTATGALVQIDQARVDAVNSVTPYGVNAALIDQMAAIYGVTRGTASNTNAYVVFTGTPGYVINPGVIVSDGTYQYTVQDAATLDSNGLSGNVYVVATSSGSWPVAAGTITSVVSSVPTGYTLTVTNSAAGTPGSDAESDTSFRYRVIQSGAASCQSTPRFIKSNVGNVAGVTTRTIAVPQYNGGFLVQVGGGDPYQIAGAIYQSVADINTLQSSVNTITSASQAASAVITTELTHGLTAGETVVISGATGMTQINGTWTNIAIVNNHSFTISANTSSASAYTGNGILQTNPRNETVNIIDAPDTYEINFVVPLQETVQIVVAWNTNATNTVSNASVVSLASPALVSYINGIQSGAPIILYQLENTFASAIADLVPRDNLTRMEFTVYIGGEQVAVETDTGIIQGDTQSYLYTVASNISIARG